MALSDKQKNQMQAHFIDGSMSMQKIADEMGLSKPTVIKYHKEYKLEKAALFQNEAKNSARMAKVVDDVAGEAENFAHDSRIAVELIKYCLAKIKSPETTKTDIEHNWLKIKAAKDAIAALTDRNKHLREITGADKTNGVEEEQKKLIESLDELVRRDQERQTSHLRLAKQKG